MIGRFCLWKTILLSALILNPQQRVAAYSAETPSPQLDVVFPAGGRAGSAVEVTLFGQHLADLRQIRCSAPEVTCRVLGDQRVELQIPETVIPGTYELWAECRGGISNSRLFMVGHLAEQHEANERANEQVQQSAGGEIPGGANEGGVPQSSTQADSTIPLVTLRTVINGRISSAGESDCYRFQARRGQRIVIECFAERLESRLRAVLELRDRAGRRLLVSRGYHQHDPLIDFQVTTDAEYIICVHDLTFTGGSDHIYRLAIDDGPRVAFAFPGVIQRGTSQVVTLSGWNLHPAPAAADRAATEFRADERGAEPPADRTRRTDSVPFDQLPVTISADALRPDAMISGRLHPAAGSSPAVWYLPGSQSAVAIDITDHPVVLSTGTQDRPELAQLVRVPSEVCGQLIDSRTRDWYAIDARQGEVFWLEGRMQRLGAPGDLQLEIFDAAAEQELARFTDTVDEWGDPMLSLGHLDPEGRWVAPSDGRFLICVRSAGGGLPHDPRRSYRLVLKREVPDYAVAVLPRRQRFGRLNVAGGGREILDVVVRRFGGCSDAIRLTADSLPAGLTCPDVWIGPNERRGIVVVTAAEGSSAAASLKLSAESSGGLRRPVQVLTATRSSASVQAARRTSQLPVMVVGQTPFRILTLGDEPVQHHLYGTLTLRPSPGSLMDVAVHVERLESANAGNIRITAAGLPEGVRNEATVIPAGVQKGYLSFYLPPSMPAGKWSMTIQAEVSIRDAGGTESIVSVPGNVVNFEVHPAAFRVEADPFSPTRARRGETIQVKYSSIRRNGFIGKMHTELAAPGVITDVPGIRGRGETFTGLTDTGSLQIVINDDAAIGPRPYLRLLTVGVVEDRPEYFGSYPLSIEITE